MNRHLAHTLLGPSEVKFHPSLQTQSNVSCLIHQLNEPTTDNHTRNTDRVSSIYVSLANIPRYYGTFVLIHRQNIVSFNVILQSCIVVWITKFSPKSCFQALKFNFYSTLFFFAKLLILAMVCGLDQRL